MGGAAGTGLRGVTVSRAAHQALRTDVEHHGIRADRYCRMSISTRGTVSIFVFKAVNA